MATEFPRVRGIPSCVNLSTYVQGMSDYELLCEVIQVVNKLSELASLSVITYADPLQWNITTQYSANTVVVDPETGVAYLSKQPVPAGVQIFDTNYWTKIANFGGIYNQLISAITNTVYEKFGMPAREAIKTDSLVWIDNVLYKCVTPVSAGQNILSTSFIQTNLDTEFENLVEQYKQIVENTTSDLNRRLSNIIADGTQTEGNVELIDIRTGSDGKVYPTAGDAVRGQVGSLSEEKVGVGLAVNNSNYSELNIHSIYDLPVNSVNRINRLTSDMVSGLPEYGDIGTLIRINPDISEAKENEFSCYLYYGLNGKLYYTFGTSSSTINKWNEILTKTDNTVLSAKINEYVSPDVLVSNNIHSIYDMPRNSISALSSEITEEQLRGLPVYGRFSTFIRFNPYTLYNLKDQFSIYLLFNTDEMWFTFGTGIAQNSGWKKIALYTDVDLLNENLETLKNEIDELKCKPGNGFSAFSRFAVVGDSLSVGYYTDSDNVQHDTDYYHSWPAYAGRLSGSTPYWCGASGQTCKSWLEKSSGDWGLEYTKSLGTMPLYVIAMGANESGIAIGSSSDIGTDSDTLYAYVSKTIEKLREISPKSYIVCTGISRGQGLNNRINDVYEDVCSYYDKCYYMDVESELNSEEFEQYYFNYHYSAFGYFKMAVLYNYKLGKIMDENVSDFLYINESEENVIQPK